MSSTDKAAAPKFESFKLKAPQKISKDERISLDGGEEGRKRRNDEDRPKHKRHSPSKDRGKDNKHPIRHESRSQSRGEHRHQGSRHRSRSRSRGEHRHRRSRHRSRSRSPVRERLHKHREESKPNFSSAHYTQKHEVVNEATEDKETLYKVDQKGDPLILAYGSLHRGDVPNYKRIGYGCVLGMPSDERIDRDKSTDRLIEFESKIHKPRQKEKNTLSTISTFEDRELRFVLPDRQAPLENAKAESTVNRLEELQLDFQYLKDDRARQQGPDHLTGSESVDYRSIEGNFLKKSTSGESDIESTALDVELPSQWNEIRSQNADLNRLVKDNPKDVEAWQRLIEHQENVIRMNRSDDSMSLKLSASEKRSLAEVRISIYRKALSHINKSAHREQLLLGQMEEAANVLDETKLVGKWEEVLKSNPSSVKLWTTYLNHAQTSFREFTHSHCLSTYKKCLEILSQARADDSVIEMQVYVFLRLTVFLLDSGFSEFSMALWQALIEFNLYRPSNISATSEALKLFEEFWDSEVERVGERGGLGWGNFQLNGGEPKEELRMERNIHIKASDGCFVDFGQSELMLQKELRWPGRAGDEVWDDPYHLVMFSDVKPWLELLPSKLDTCLLLQAFLTLVGLPPLALVTSSTVRGWQHDSFFESNFKSFSSRTSSPKGVLWLKPSAAPNAVMEPMTLAHSACESPTFFDKNAREFVGYILAAFLGAIPESEILSEYHLRFMMCQESNHSKKSHVARKLIKASPKNLRLYNQYALIELNEGDHIKAKEVWKTALAMAHTLPEREQENIPLLWHTYAFSTALLGNLDQALMRLVRGANKSTSMDDIQPSELLKATKAFTDARDHCIDTRKPIPLVYNSMLLALLSDLQNGDIESTVKAASTSNYFVHATNPTDLMAEELHHQLLAQLLHFHFMDRPTKPKVFQGFLLASLVRFPQNTVLLDIYQAHENKFGLEDRLRGAINSLPAPSAPNTAYLQWTIHRESLREQSGAGTIHSVLAAFERAVESPNGLHSRSLWTQYCLTALKHSKPEEAKKVFLKGVTKLPWCKGYMMMAFNEMKDVLSFEEMRGVYNIMMEKELRVFVELGDILEEWDEMQEKMNVDE